MLDLILASAMREKNKGGKEFETLRVDPWSTCNINILCNKENKNKTWSNDGNIGSAMKEIKGKEMFFV